MKNDPLKDFLKHNDNRDYEAPPQEFEMIRERIHQSTWSFSLFLYPVATFAFIAILGIFLLPNSHPSNSLDNELEAFLFTATDLEEDSLEVGSDYLALIE